MRVNICVKSHQGVLLVDSNPRTLGPALQKHFKVSVGPGFSQLNLECLGYKECELRSTSWLGPKRTSSSFAAKKVNVQRVQSTELFCQSSLTPATVRHAPGVQFDAIHMRLTSTCTEVRLLLLCSRAEVQLVTRTKTQHHSMLLAVELQSAENVSTAKRGEAGEAFYGHSAAAGAPVLQGAWGIPDDPAFWFCETNSKTKSGNMTIVVSLLRAQLPTTPATTTAASTASRTHWCPRQSLCSPQA